jgi:hypothetical protein
VGDGQTANLEVGKSGNGEAVDVPEGIDHSIVFILEGKMDRQEETEETENQ